jgi:hypothetical protein
MAEVASARRGDVALLLQDSDVIQIRVDYAVSFVFSSDMILRISGAIHFAASGSHTDVEPEGEPAQLAPLLAVRSKRVTDATLTEAGAITVTLTDDIVIAVEPSPTFEAWELSGPDGTLVVCPPGGGITMWSAGA